MSSSSSTTTGAMLVPFFTQRHQEALELEFQVLGLILRKNRSSHKRTRYFRRAESACKYYYKNIQPQQSSSSSSSSLSSMTFSNFETWIKNLSQLERTIHLEQEQIRRQQKRKAILWEMVQTDKERKSGDNDASTSPATNKSIDTQISIFLTQLRDDWMSVISHQIPTLLLGKMEAAGIICFDEMARGFFLPFHTVLVGCLARIHILLSRYRFYIATQLLQQLTLVRNLLDDDDNESNNIQVNKKKEKIYSYFYSRLNPQQRHIISTTRQELECIVQTLNTSQQLLPTVSSSSTTTTLASTRTFSILQRLGIIDKMKVDYALDGEPEENNEKEEATTLEEKTEKVTTTPNTDSPKQPPENELAQPEVNAPEAQPPDLGESIGRMDAGSSSWKERHHPFSTSAEEVDAHDLVLEKLGKNKKESKNKRKPSDQSKEKRKKKPKKKPKANDFFDQLFG